MDRNQALEKALNAAAAAEKSWSEILDQILMTASDHRRRDRMMEDLAAEIELSKMWSQLALALPESAEGERCFSCDHLASAHEAAGCNQVIKIDREAGVSQCPCAVGAVSGKVNYAA